MAKRISESILDEQPQQDKATSSTPSPQKVEEKDDIAKPKIIEERVKMASSLSSGNAARRRVMAVHPSIIRVRDDHDRDLGALDEESCADLIHDFRSSTGQLMPVIVHQVKDDSKYEYELVAGGRRHWTATYLDMPLIVDIRDHLDDREVFRVTEWENDHRQDIPDFQKAMKYLNALNNKVYDTAKQLAIDVQKSPGFVSDMLNFARMPTLLASKIENLYELSEYRYRTHKKLLVDKDNTLLPAIEAHITSLPDRGIDFDDLIDFATGTSRASRPASKKIEQVKLRDPKSDRVIFNMKNNPKKKVIQLEIARDMTVSKEEFLATLSHHWDSIMTDNKEE